MDNIIIKKSAPVVVAGLTVKKTAPAVAVAVDTGLTTPIKVAGLTVKNESVKVIITLLSDDDLKKLNK